jgi:ABC-type transport system substrate-binding protein
MQGTQPHRVRSRAFGVVLVLAVVLMSACATDPESSTDGPGLTVGTTPTSELAAGPPQSGGSLSYGIASETNSLTPGVGQWASSAIIVANAIYEPLAARRIDGTVQPYLAEAITANAEFTEWTIRTRPGVSFHDGTPFDALAVAANLEFTRSSALAGAALKPITSVSAVDATTVRVTMSKPWSTFPNAMAGPSGYMAAPSMYATPNPAAADPVGTGPFVFRSREINANVIVDKNPAYWQAGEPLLDSITFKIISDDKTRADAMRAGDVDAIEINTPQLLIDYLAESDAGRAQVLTNAGRETNEFVVALNTSAAPFDDLLARQVLAAGINQDELAAVLTDGVWPPAWGNFEPDSPFFISPEEAGYPLADPMRAHALADQYRQEHGQPLTFTFTVNADAISTRLGQVVEQQLRPFGVVVEVKQVEQVKSITDVLSGDYQAGFFAMFSSPTLDTGYNFIATEPSPTGISTNYTRLFDPEITAAMDAARATDDRQAQVDQYEIVQRRMAANLDRIFLYHVRSADAFTNEVHGFTAATFPGSSERAVALDITYPFFTDIWVQR